MFAALLKYLIINKGKQLMFKKIRDALARKAMNSTKSATMGVAAGFLAAATWLQMNPEVVSSVVGQGWAGVIIALAGLAVAVARMRSL